MRKLLPIITFLLCVGLVAPASGQISLFNFNFTGDGARAKGMGGAFLSVADDGSALSWNPAGLIQVLDPQVSIEIDYFHPKSTYKLTYPNNSVRDLANPISDNKVPLQFASFSAPIRIRDHQFVASASYSSASTWLSDYTARVGLPEVDSPYVFYDKFDSRLDRLRLGFGTSIFGELKFGADINVYFGKGLFDNTLTYEDSDTIQGSLVEYMYKLALRDTITYSGVNFEGGLLWKKGGFAMGAVVKTPYWLTQKHVQHIADTLWVNGLPTTNPGIINELPKQKIQVPLDFGVGMSYKINENFLLSSDFEWRRFGSAKYREHYDTVLSNGDIQESYIEYELAMDNAYQIRVGGEYTIDAGFARVPVRAGFSHDTYGWLQAKNLQYNVSGEDEEPTDTLIELSSYGDQVTGYTLAFGMGLHWELIHLDFAFQYRSWDDNSNGTDIYGEFDAVNEYRASRLSMNFTGFFK
jgi:hypothetical protein